MLHTEHRACSGDTVLLLLLSAMSLQGGYVWQIALATELSSCAQLLWIGATGCMVSQVSPSFQRNVFTGQANSENR